MVFESAKRQLAFYFIKTKHRKEVMVTATTDLEDVLRQFAIALVENPKMDLI